MREKQRKSVWVDISGKDHVCRTGLHPLLQWTRIAFIPAATAVLQTSHLQRLASVVETCTIYNWPTKHSGQQREESGLSPWNNVSVWLPVSSIIPVAPSYSVSFLWSTSLFIFPCALHAGSVEEYNTNINLKYFLHWLCWTTVDLDLTHSLLYVITFTKCYMCGDKYRSNSSRPLAPGAVLFTCDLCMTRQHWLIL